MKKIVFVAALAALAFAGCQKEVSFETPQTNDIVLTAVSDNSPESKAILDGKNVLWNNGDCIAVYNGNEVAEFSTDAADKSATADFTTTNAQFAVAENYLAVYPYSDGLAFADGKVTVTVPASQTATAGSFDPKANVAVASGTADALQFKNVCSYLKFTVPANMTDLTKVVLSAKGGEALAGSVKAVCADASFEVVGGEASSVTLQGNFEAGKSYYIAVLPGTLAKGFTLTMTRSGDISTMPTDKAFTFTRSRSANIGELYDGTWRVALEGTAVPKGASPVLTQTLENENLFACLEDLKEGSLSLRVLFEKLYIATTFSDGKAVAYTTQNTPASITIPADGKYRIVLDKSTSKITIYSEATDVKNKVVLFKRTAGTKNDNCKEEVTRLWIFGANVYYGSKPKDPSQPKGEPYVLEQSLANPRLFVYKGETLKDDKIKFLASDNWNNEYVFGSGSTRDMIAKPAIGDTYTPLYGGQGNNRYAWFQIPAGTNYIEVYIGAPEADENEHALGKFFELSGSYVKFETR